MTIWLIKDGENLPLQHKTRPMRTGMLAAELARRGHAVVWWSSGFSHQRKEFVKTADWSGEVAPNLTLRLLHAGRYTRNISLQRYVHHYRLAQRFAAAAAQAPTPDLIVTAFPQIDISRQAVIYGATHGVPVVVDVRDLWPDVHVDKSPRLLRPLARLATHRDLKKTQRLLRDATAVVATSTGYLAWAQRHGKRQPSWRDRVVYPGYPPQDTRNSAVSPRLQDIINRVAGKTVFTFVGSFGHSYELDLICAVAAQASASKLDDVHFVLAGDGEQYAKVAAAAAQLRNVTLTGWLDREEIGAVLRMSHVGLVACSSVRDTMPNKPFEYMSAGLPIVSSLEGEMAEIIARYHIGFTYPAGDASALLHLVRNLTGDATLRKQMSDNSRRVFNDVFSSDRIIKDYADHLEKLAGERRSLDSNAPTR